VPTRGRAELREEERGGGGGGGGGGSGQRKRKTMCVVMKDVFVSLTFSATKKEKTVS